MKKSRIRDVIVHSADHAGQYALSGRLSEFHAEVIERRLKELPLPEKQKIAVIDKIIENMKQKETGGGNQ